MASKILLVEDEEEIRGTIAAELDDAGYQVVQAANGQEGLDAIRSERPDLILSDISMPVLDGIGMLESVRRDLPDQVETPFIFLTAYSDRERQIAARRHGADEFLNKPVEFDVLLAVVENQLRKRRTTRRVHNEEMVKLFTRLRPQKDRSSVANGRDADGPMPGHSLLPDDTQARPRSLGGWITLIGLSEIKEKLGPRWDSLASTVKSLAENRIAQNLVDEDTYRIINDDTFEVCIHRKTEAESSATVRRIKQQILDGLGTIDLSNSGLPDVSDGDTGMLRQVQAAFYPMPTTDNADSAGRDPLDVVSAKIERAAHAFAQNSGQMLSEIVQSGEIQLIPILDRNLTSSELVHCALDPAASSIELRMRAAFAHDPQKMLELDTAKFGLAIQTVISSPSRQFKSFVVSVDVNSIRIPKNRQQYLSLLNRVPPATRSKFVFLVENGLGQVHASLLTDMARSLKPYSVSCWLRATTSEPFDKCIDEAVAPVVAMNFFDLESSIRTGSEKLKAFRKNMAASKISFMVDGLINSHQQVKARNIAPHYYCFDGNIDAIYSNI